MRFEFLLETIKVVTSRNLKPREISPNLLISLSPSPCTITQHSSKRNHHCPSLVQVSRQQNLTPSANYIYGRPLHYRPTSIPVPTRLCSFICQCQLHAYNVQAISSSKDRTSKTAGGNGGLVGVRLHTRAFVDPEMRWGSL
ncbi:hypothetical protein CY34DRAFT_813684, partial [Suillus luteus UH-Slu-Lm8-n1]